MTDKTILARLTAELVSAYVGNKSLSETELDSAIELLPTLISRVHEALLKIVIEPASVDEAAELAAPQRASIEQDSDPPLAPPNVGKTVFADHLVCLEDGLKFKTLKRHLAVHHELTPDAYRKKWGLPDDYPMAAPDYAASRAAIAKKIGLGASGRGGQPAIMQRPQGKGRGRKSS